MEQDVKILTFDDVKRILGLTIKGDDDSKLITFLCALSAYTDSSQFNVSFNAPSSTGKSYIPLEIAQLFPEKDVIILGYCSPAAFFHDQTDFDFKLKVGIVNLERKILIFMDQPNPDLLQRIRPLLSHDKKRIDVKVTDKTNKFGLKTKNITVIGYPSVIFCSAGLNIDEQEATRFILLSPDMDQEKIRAAVFEKIKKEADKQRYCDELDRNPDRANLKVLIKEIKMLHITEVIIENQEEVKKKFLDSNRFLKSRHMRDVNKIISLIKASAILDYKHRKREGTVLWANDHDIEQGFALWERIRPSQELNLPPYVYKIYEDIVVPLCKGGIDIDKEDMQTEYYKKYNTPLPDWKIRQDILPALQASSLIIIKPDPEDKRRIKICLA